MRPAACCETCGRPLPGSAQPLTVRQHGVLAFISAYIAEYGYAPKFEEIGGALGMRSLSTVSEHVKTLERKGHIRRRYNATRSIELAHEDAPPGSVSS